MSTPSLPDWLTELIDEEGESKPMDVLEREKLLGALQAAYSPSPLDPKAHQRILEQAIAEEDPFAAPSEEELREAAILRDHLDSDPLVVSMRVAHGTQTPAVELKPNLDKLILTTPLVSRTKPLRIQAQAFWGAIAVAAAIALWIGVTTSGTSTSFEPSQRSLAVSRSTESLFSKPFDTSSPSERIDKIAQVRARDLRNNRYAQWGLP